MKKFSWKAEEKVAPHWYKIRGWLPNRYLPLVMFDSICIYKPNMKGGHRHNQWKNAMARMRKCHICGAPIVKGCEVVSQNGWNEFQCRSCWTDENIEQACLVGISFGGMIYKVRKFRRY